MTVFSSKTEMEAKPTFRKGYRATIGMENKGQRSYKREVREVRKRGMEGRVIK